MKNSKKFIAILLVFAMLAGVMCGCKKQEETGDEEFNYSKYISANGYYENIKALDYIKLDNLDKIEVLAADVQAEIDAILKTRAYQHVEQSTTRTIVDGDVVNIDYVGSVDGVEFDGGSTQGMGTEVEIGVTSYIDNFLEQLIGHKPGDEFDINVTFPENYGVDELNGKPAVFKTKVNYVNVYTPNQLTDDFVKEFFEDEQGWATVEDLKKGIADGLGVNQVFDGAEFDINALPTELGDQYVERMIFEAEQMAANYGVDINTYISYAYGTYGISDEATLRMVFENYKMAAVSEMLIYQAIAETKGLKVTDADLKAYYEKYGVTNTADIEKMFGKPYLMNTVLCEKVEALIHDAVVVK